MFQTSNQMVYVTNIKFSDGVLSTDLPITTLVVATSLLKVSRPS